MNDHVFVYQKVLLLSLLAIITLAVLYHHIKNHSS